MYEVLPPDEAEKIYENDNVLIVSPLTHSANKYYGEGTPWYEDGRWGWDDFTRRKERGGKIYYIINKEDGTKKSFYKNRYGEVYEDDNTELSKNEIKEFVKLFPSAKRIILDITSNQIFKKFREFLKGKISIEDLTNSDDLISKITYNPQDPLESKVRLRFKDDEEFYDFLELNDDDTWFMNLVNRTDFEFMDSDRLWNDNQEGYGLFRFFDQENLNKLKTIAKFFKSESEFDPNNETYMGELYLAIDKLFSRDLDNMGYKLMEEINSRASENARTYIAEEINSFLKEHGFTLVRDYDELITTIGNIIHMYSLRGNTTLDLREMIKSEFQSKDKKSIGGWGNDYYEFDDGRIDDIKLNEYFSKELDDILEKLEENEGFRDFLEMYDRIVSKWGMNRNNSTPKDQKIIFKVIDIDPKTMKVTVDLMNNSTRQRIRHSFSEADFNKFIYNPEIFSIFEN